MPRSAKIFRYRYTGTRMGLSYREERATVRAKEGGKAANRKGTLRCPSCKAGYLVSARQASYFEITRAYL